MGVGGGYQPVWEAGCSRETQGEVLVGFLCKPGGRTMEADHARKLACSRVHAYHHDLKLAGPTVSSGETLARAPSEI